jgi:hypothetical protein
MEPINITKAKRKRYYYIKNIYKYAVFAGETFYPAGGFNDFYGYARTYTEALNLYNEAKTTGTNLRSSWWAHQSELEARGPCDWCHVVNIKKNKIVYQ